jgi:hypothetical protein
MPKKSDDALQTGGHVMRPSWILAFSEGRAAVGRTLKHPLR